MLTTEKYKSFLQKKTDSCVLQTYYFQLITVCFSNLLCLNLHFKQNTLHSRSRYFSAYFPSLFDCMSAAVERQGTRRVPSNVSHIMHTVWQLILSSHWQIYVTFQQQKLH